MIFIMSLFAAPTMADDRVQQTNWALADEPFCFCLRPIGWRVALRCGNEIKTIVANGALLRVLTLPR
jgi:hypothetical protein